MSWFNRSQAPPSNESKATPQDVVDLAAGSSLSQPQPVGSFEVEAAAAPTTASNPPPNSQVPARKATKGTSYTATGVDGVNPPLLNNEIGSSQPVRIREVVPELISPFQRTITYGAMMNDAGVDVSIRVAKTPVLGAEFFMEAYSTTPLDTEISEFVWANLAEGMSAPFLNALDDILGMYVDGYSVLEKVYELRDWAPHRQSSNARTMTMLKKLGVRPASTAKQIDYDDQGGPLTFTQSAIRADGTPEDVVLPIEKIMIFTFSRRGGDLTGKSLLRTAYPHWYYKTHFYKIDAVQKERHSLGVPRGKLLAGYNANDKLILRQMLRNIRTNEEAFFIQTPNIEIDFAKVEGQLVDVLGSAKEHNAMILLNVLGQFLVLGMDSGGGGRATGATQTDMFMKSLRYVANYIVDQINMYLIPELVVWNYPTTNFPKLKVRNLGETRDLQMFGAAIANLVAQEAIEVDNDTEEWIRRIFDMPTRMTPRTETNIETKNNAAAANADAANQPPPPGNSGSNGKAPAPQPAPAKGNVKGGTGFKGKPPNAPS